MRRPLRDPRTARKPCVVAMDIDGTLGAWHEHFRQFISLYTGKPCPPRTARAVVDESGVSFVWDGSVPFWKWLGVSKSTYRQAKLAFRQGGWKRWMPVYDGAADMVREVRKEADVWICTTRPYLRLDNIDPDTRHWLKRNGIQFDGVLFGEHKYRELARIVGRENVAAVMDDLPEMVMQAHSLQLPTVLRSQPYNTPSNYARLAGDMTEAQQWLTKLVTEWRSA